MKQKVILSVALIFLMLRTFQSHGQTYRPFRSFNRDTGAYLKYNFLDSKTNYVGKSVSTVIKDLDIPINNFIAISSSWNHKTNQQNDLTIFSHLEIGSLRPANRANLCQFRDW